MGQIETPDFGVDLDPKILLLERADKCERSAVVIVEITRNFEPLNAALDGSFTFSHTELYASELYAVARMIERRADEILFGDD